MLHNIKKILLLYKVPYFILSTSVVLICFYLIYNYIFVNMISSRYFQFYSSEILYGSMFLIFCISIYFYYNHIKRVKYKQDTHGRSYSKDKQKYGKSLTDSDRSEFFKQSEDNYITVNPRSSGDWTKYHGVILGSINGHIFQRGAGSVGNIVTVGKPGSGKTTNLICTSTNFNGSLFILDIKGDIYNGVTKCLNVLNKKRKRKVLNLSNPDKSCHYNPLRGVEKMDIDEIEELLEEISCVLIPASTSSDGEYFVSTARDYFIGISLYLLYHDIKTSFSDIVNGVFQGNAIKWIQTVIESDCGSAKDFLAGKFGENERNLCGGYSKLRNQLKPFKTKAILELLTDNGNCISGEDLNNGTDIYLRMTKKEMARNSALVTMIIQDMLNTMLARVDNTSGKTNINSLFMLDEFSQLRRIGSLSPDDPQISLADALATLRSKSCTLQLCMQSISQIDKVYSANVRKEIFDTCEFFQIFSVQDPETREYFANLFGKKDVLNVSSSSSGVRNSETTKSTSKNREYIIQPEEFGKFTERNKVAIYNNGRYAIADKVQYFTADERLLQK